MNRPEERSHLPCGLSRSARFLVWLAGLCHRSPLAVVLLGTLWCVVSVWYAAETLYFETDRSALVARDGYLQRSLETYLEEFPASEDMVVVVEGGSEAERRAFVDDLAGELRRDPHAFRDVFEKVELPFLETHALHYMDTGDLARLVEELKANHSLLVSLGTSGDMVGLLDSFHLGSGDVAGLSRILPFLNQTMERLLISLQTRGRYTYRSPWAELFFDPEGSSEVPEGLLQAGRPVFYNTLDGGRIYLVLARKASRETFAPATDSVRRVRELLVRVQRRHMGVTARLTGEPVLEADEMLSSEQDSRRSALLSLVLVSLLFAFTFREVVRPLLAVYSLILGIGWTVGYTALFIGHLNLLTVTFATILVGLGIDFGIHILYRYDEERRTGLGSLAAMQRTLAGTGVENLTGALSTAAAFWALYFTDSQGIAELGLIAGTGVVLCYLSMVTVLPSLLYLKDRLGLVDPELVAHGGGVLGRLESRWLSRPSFVVALCTVFTLACAFLAPRIRYDYNLLNLQSQGLESVRTELHLVRSSEHSILFAISLADDLGEARRLSREFERLPLVSQVESIVPLVPEDYEEKRPYLEEVEELMAGVALPPPPATGERTDLRGMASGFLELQRVFEESYPDLLRSRDVRVRRETVRFKSLLDRLFSSLEGMGPGPIEDGLTAFRRDFFTDLRNVLKFLKQQRAAPPLTLQDIPEQLRIRSIGRSGRIILRVYPRENLWERSSLRQFVKVVQHVDPDIIGMPVLIYYDTEELKRANEVAGWYAFGAICLILLVHFRSLKVALLALFPKGIGVLWMVALMVYYGVDFNSANFLGLPLILGIGLVFGVHVVHRVMEEGSEALFNHSTGPAVALSAITTMVGFGTLVPSLHQGIASLGWVMTVGVGANLVASVFYLPALLKVLRERGVGL